MKKHCPWAVLALLCVLPHMASAERSVFARTEVPYTERIESLQQATRGDIRELFDALNELSMVEVLSSPQELSYLNEVMNALRRLSAPDEPLEAAFVTLATDESRLPGMREYAVQHLGSWARVSDNAYIIVQALEELTKDPIVSTSAILQLHHLRQSRAAMPREKWNGILEYAFARPDLREADRLTLLLVAKEQNWIPALPYARAWAQHTPDAQTFAAAISTLGVLGTSADVEWLNTLRNSPHAEAYNRLLDRVEEKLRNKQNGSIS